ncbi:MAG: flagellar hook-basal body protein [Planctomycetota bacterium]|jgi:flagellar basal body rod protein FlgG
MASEQMTSSIDALMQEFYIISHNLANAGTVGYKRRCNAFSQALESQMSASSDYSPGKIDIESALDFSQGGIVETGRPLDFSLHGKGFFVLESPEGTQYTRNGIFNTNPNGQIVNSSGKTVSGEGGPITVPAGISHSQIRVSNDGNVSAGGVVIGKFRLVDFGDNQSELASVGDFCYQMPDSTITPIAVGNLIVKQGYQESSNVKIVDELVDMIMVSRLYESNMKLVSAERSTSSSIVGVAMG